MNDTFVGTSALSTEVGVNSSNSDTEQFGIFVFDAIDEVAINNLVVNYSYDMDHCVFSHFAENEEIENGTAKHYTCTNPLILIDNYGQIEMTDIRMNVEFENVPKHSDYIYDVFGYTDNGYGFIDNFGVLNIENLVLQVK